MINHLLYYKQKDTIEKGYIKNGFLFNKEDQRILFKGIKPIIKREFVKDIQLPYKIHPAVIHKQTINKHINIKIGFIFSNNRKDFIMGLKTGNEYIILNPIIVSSSLLLDKKQNISVFVDGKKKLSFKSKPEIYNNIALLDFYPIIDKIFYDFGQLDAVIDKTNIIVSFKFNGG